MKTKKGATVKKEELKKALSAAQLEIKKLKKHISEIELYAEQQQKKLNLWEAQIKDLSRELFAIKTTSIGALIRERNEAAEELEAELKR